MKAWQGVPLLVGLQRLLAGNSDPLHSSQTCDLGCFILATDTTPCSASLGETRFDPVHGEGTTAKWNVVCVWGHAGVHAGPSAVRRCRGPPGAAAATIHRHGEGGVSSRLE